MEVWNDENEGTATGRNVDTPRTAFFLKIPLGNVTAFRYNVRSAGLNPHGISRRNKLLRETSQESPLIRLLRAGVLLGTLIMIPGVAVCWNLLPKPHYASPSAVAEAVTEVREPEDTDAFFPPIYTEPPLIQAPPLRPAPLIEQNPTTAPFPSTAAAPNVIKAMNWPDEAESTTIPIPSVIRETASAAVPAVPVAEPSPQQSFPRLEIELQSLGVKYYRLEKWGSRSELFRCCCYVTATEPYSYQKCFQAIDRDEIRAMEQVITKIKAWQR